MHATQANRRPLVVDLVDINFAPTVAGGLILIILANPSTWPQLLLGRRSLFELSAMNLICARVVCNCYIGRDVLL